MKKLGAIISLSVIGVLILLTIILSVAPLSHKINIKSPDQITIYGSETMGGVYYEDDKIYKDVVSLIDEGFKEKTLSALFNGRANYKTSITTSTTSAGLSSMLTNGVWVRYQYSPAQTMMDGKKEFTGSGTTAIKCESIFFTIEEEDELAKLKAYVVTDTSSSDFVYSYYYTVMANFSEVYDYIKAL